MPFLGVLRGSVSPLLALEGPQVAFAAYNTLEANQAGVEAILPDADHQGEDGGGSALPLLCGAG